MAKCNACGRFISVSAEVAKCGKCTSVYHRPCVGLNESSKIVPSWCCPSCKVKKPRGDNADTPVKSLHGEGLGDEDSTASSLTSTYSRSDAATALSDSTKILESDKSSLLLEQFKEVRDELRALRTEIQTYRKEVAELKSAVTLNNTRLGTLDTRMDSLEGKFQDIQLPPVKELEVTVMHLRQELNERDQLSLANDVEISSLPEEAGENSTHLALLIGAKLGVKFEERDIIYAERVGQKRESSTVVPGDDPIAQAMGPRPRTLVIRFVRRTLRNDLLRAARVRRGITTADVGLTGNSRRFYVNERLSKHNRQVFYKARKLCDEHNWKFCWTKFGTTFVRQAQGKTAYRVTNLENLNRIFGID